MRAIEVALNLAEAQLARLNSGDIDGFLAFEDVYAAACEAAAALAPDAASLDRLLAVVAAISRCAATVGDEARQQMARLGGRRTGIAAYTATAA